MVKYVHKYARRKGFLHLHKCKDHFASADVAASLFSGAIDAKYPQSGFFSRSNKSQGHIKAINCCFHLNYIWDSSKKSFVFGCSSSNVNHNHQLFPHLTYVDGCVLVNFEQSLTHDEFLSIREQSHCRVQVP